MQLRSIQTTTPLGIFAMLIDEHEVVCAAGFSNSESLRQRLPQFWSPEPPEELTGHRYEAAIQDYFKGNLGALHTIPYSQEGSEYYKSIWNAMAKIKPGKTATYAELSAQSTSPTAIRAAGTACGKNKIILLVPCHRIIKSDGTVGSYLYGADIKKALLTHELANFKH